MRGLDLGLEFQLMITRCCSSKSFFIANSRESSATRGAKYRKHGRSKNRRH